MTLTRITTAKNPARVLILALLVTGNARLRPTAACLGGRILDPPTGCNSSQVLQGAAPGNRLRRILALHACRRGNDASYCNARSRIPTKVLRTLATRTAEELQASGRGSRTKRHRRKIFVSLQKSSSVESDTILTHMGPCKPHIGDI